MKHAMVTLWIACGLSSCAETSIITVEQAVSAARSGKAQEVVVVGYYIYHFEGDELNVSPGEQTGSGPWSLILNFRPMIAAKDEKGIADARRRLGDRFSQKHVVIKGTLRRGTYPDAVGDLTGVEYIEVRKIYEDLSYDVSAR